MHIFQTNLYIVQFLRYYHTVMKTEFIHSSHLMMTHQNLSSPNDINKTDNELQASKKSLFYWCFRIIWECSMDKYN